LIAALIETRHHNTIQRKMKTTTSKKIKVKETLEVDYTDFMGPIDQVMARVDRYKAEGWEGLEVAALYWSSGAVYELYKYRDETEAEAVERVRVEGERRQKKLDKLNKLKKELDII